MDKTKEIGNSLVEVLVAVIVLSVAALGAAGMQITSKKATHEAQQRFIATYLANDMMEKIRNNPSAQATYAEGDLTGATIASAPETNCSDGNTCSSEELAHYDRWLWEQALVKNLIEPTGCITIDADRLIKIVVVWWGAEALESHGAGNDCGSVGEHRRSVMNISFIDN